MEYKKIYIYGSGNFGQQVNTLLNKNGFFINGYIDSDFKKAGTVLEGIEIFNIEEILRESNYLIIIASTYFYEIEQLLIGKSCKSYYIIYPQQINLNTLNDGVKNRFVDYKESVIFLNSCSIRMDTIQKLERKVKIDDNTIVGCNFIFESNEGEIKIGANTYIGAGTNLISRKGITIGDNVTISWGCYIYDHNSHSLNYLDRREDFKRYREDYLKFGNPVVNKDWGTVDSNSISIGNDAWIGFEVTILKGVTIGEGAVVGAKSVVTKDVPPWSVVAGNPAKIIKYLNEGC